MKSNNLIKLSIIVPHYNSPDLLANLLNTIPNDPQIEVIVVDDHSTIKLEELSRCKQKFGDRNIFFYENDLDKKGAGTARNKGIRYSIGEYLLFADADDWFVCDFWNSVQESMTDGAELIYYAPCSQNTNGEPSERHVHYAELVNNYLLDPSHQHELKLRYLYWSPCSKLIKRSVVVKHHICYDEGRCAEDLIFSVKVGHYAKEIKASEKIIYCILDHEGSLTTHNDEAHNWARQKALFRYYFFMRRKMKWHDFKLLGYNLNTDYMQIKSIISVFLREHRSGIIRKHNRGGF